MNRRILELATEAVRNNQMYTLQDISYYSDRDDLLSSKLIESYVRSLRKLAADIKLIESTSKSEKK